MFEEKDDTILARWIAGKLTEAEHTEFQNSSEYAEYIRLKEGFKAFTKPDFEKEALRKKIWEGIDTQKSSKIINLKPLYYTIGVAASVLFIVGIFFNNVTYSTGAGETRMFELPDGTEVTLNSKTTLKHKRFFWKANRQVNLTGEAYFSVIKGDDFKVKTHSGTVSVLGTQFNVKARESSF